MHGYTVFQFGKVPTQIYFYAVLQQIKAQRNEGTKENIWKKMFNYKNIKAHIKTLKQETFYL